MDGGIRAVLWLCFYQAVNLMIYVGGAFFIDKDKEKAKDLLKSLGLFTCGIFVSAFVYFIGSL